MNSSPLHVVIAIIFNADRNQVLISQRQTHQDYAGCFEFPGGKINLNEAPEHALQREILEELALEITHCSLFYQFSYQTEKRTLYFHAFVVQQFQGIPAGQEGQKIFWLPINQLDTQTFPPANAILIQKLQSHYETHSPLIASLAH